MYIVVIDQGTSSTRAILFNLQGQMVTQSSFPLTQYFPQTGWVEHCPEEIWRHTIQALKRVCQQVKTSEILGLAITNQRETSLIWDKHTGKCLSKAIVWQDRRTQNLCSQLEVHNSLIHKKTGLKCDPYFSATKIKWLMDEYHPNPQDVLFGTIDSFLLWRLTNGKSHKTDVTNASRTLLCNIHKQSWDDELLEIFNIPKIILPEICSSDANYGDLDPSLLGFSCPIHAVIGDQQSALIGIGCTEPGDLKVTYGTGGFVMLNTGHTPHSSQHGLLSTVAYKIRNQTFYALEGNINDAGSLMPWLRDQLELIENYEESGKIASSVKSSDGVYFIPSFSGIGAPHWIRQCGAAFTGLSRSTTKAHLVRATLESIAFQTKDILSTMRQETNINISRLKVDGGMVNNQWFLNFLSALDDALIHVPCTFENTAKGAAMIVALKYSPESSLNLISKQWQKDTILPSYCCSTTQNAYKGWQRVISEIK